MNVLQTANVRSHVVANPNTQGRAIDIMHDSATRFPGPDPDAKIRIYQGQVFKGRVVPARLNQAIGIGDDFIGRLFGIPNRQVS